MYKAFLGAGHVHSSARAWLRERPDATVPDLGARPYMKSITRHRCSDGQLSLALPASGLGAAAPSR